MTLNNRVFYACQAVFYRSRNGEGSDSSSATTFITGVSAVGVSYDTPSRSLFDHGRAQRKYTHYDQQNIEITVSRAIEIAGDTFYKSQSYGDYRGSHILHENNIGCDGYNLRNYDITLVYGPDDESTLGIDQNPGGATTLRGVTFSNCLVSNISYNMSVDGVVEETITFVTKSVREDGAGIGQALPLVSTTELLKREHFDFLDGVSSNSSFPDEVDSLFNIGDDSDKILGIQSVVLEVSFDYNRLLDNGKWRGAESQSEQNRYTHVIVPVSINCSITGVVRESMRYSNFLSGGASEIRNVDDAYTASRRDGSYLWQTADRAIRICAKTGAGTQKFIWDLGGKNYLTSIEYSGGDAGMSAGGNVEATLSYSNQYSDFVVAKGTVVDVSNAPIF